MRTEFEKQRDLAERALSQLANDDFFRALDPESNSIAHLVKHLAGNLRSRWTDFLTSDGEKPDRKRDTEFEITAADSEAALRARWDAAWQRLFDELAKLRPEDLDRKVVVRGEQFLALEAIHRSLTHAAHHVGQIVFLAKHLAGPRWQTLSIPRGQSEEFNRKMRGHELPGYRPQT